MKRVYDMSFAEFQIRLFSWRRIENRNWEKVRILAWHTMKSSINAPKHMPSLERFMPLDDDSKIRSGVSDEQRRAFLEAYENYLIQVKNG